MSALLKWVTAQESIWRTGRHHSDKTAPFNGEHLLQRHLRRHILQFKPAAGPSLTMTKITILRPGIVASSDADYHYTARDFFSARLSPCEGAASMTSGGALPQQIIVEL